ncbi:MAG TPA: hypothetical protein VII12_11075 [Thermoanaerobaculia bacterium]
MHHVRLALTHWEMTIDRGLSNHMQISLRLPYDIKEMRVRYTTLDGAPFVPPYGDIHHRNETLRGISDGSLMLDWSPQSQWLFGLGTTLPLGHTVPDPVALGRLGLKHEHIQFGSGTLQPILAAQWSKTGTVPLFARVEGRLSLYENGNGYRAPNTFTWTAGPSFGLGRFWLAPSVSGQYQTVGRWNGAIDEGSGFQNGGIQLQFSAPISAYVVSPGVYRELWSRGFQEQTFRQGTTWSLNVSRRF